ncbi:MAG: hypothetical protein QOK31_856 [Solirubrobacteraceae bacterium]|jgi:hypothetical protein|nr:hypothetical protein [Solirubrobacteraceae bacterium]
MAVDRTRTLRGAAAGAAAATVWAAQQPLDKRLFGSSYDDVELLGKLFTRGRWWAPLGLVMHIGNGAIFGAVYARMAAAPALERVPAAGRGVVAALAEHVGLWPAGRLADRFHPARSELPRLTGNRRAFAQATWRHALFGAVLGELSSRLTPAVPTVVVPEGTFSASSNGHGSLEHAGLGQPAS